jgi:uncharacterized radical SAM superfamily protein
LKKNRTIGFSAPGIKHYDNIFYTNDPFSFAALSVTGGRCDLGCAHCNGALLSGMYDASTNEKFIECVDKLTEKGCKGILVSGGSGADGSVPVLSCLKGIGYAKEKGLIVVVHTGLTGRKTAAKLKSANVDQILLDVVGSGNTIRRVYGTDKKPEDYYRSMLICREVGLKIAPHLVIGLDHGQIEGEYDAIGMVHRAKAETFVMAVLTPKRGTKMQDVPPPGLEDVLKVFRYASDVLGETKITLGCARPYDYTLELEKSAVDLGFDAIAYPHTEAIRYAEQTGFETYFTRKCCSLL